MHPGSRHIFFLATAILVISMLYFLGLIVAAPMALIVVVILLVLVATGRWFYRATLPAAPEGRFMPLLILIVGISLLSHKAWSLAMPYGGWDAWAMWNYHARLLSDPQHWQMLFGQLQFAHPDYPLCLPSFSAFWSRLLTGGFHPAVPFVFGFLITLCIPVWIFCIQYRQNLLLAGIAMLYLATDQAYLKQGMLQYADTLLAFYFMGALLAFRHKAPWSLVLAGLMLGGCIWTKNEGVVLAGMAIVFHADGLWKQGRWRWFTAGFGLPALVWLLFKTVYAPENDMVGGQNAETWHKMADAERYRMIWDYFKRFLDRDFYYLKFVFLLYVLWSLLQRQMPSRQMFLILACVLVYMGIYVITPNDLEWHLSTSQDRLMHQLMPAMILALCQDFTDLWNRQRGRLVKE
jgi:hypothetical protein